MRYSYIKKKGLKPTILNFFRNKLTLRRLNKILRFIHCYLKNYVSLKPIYKNNNKKKKILNKESCN